MRKGGEVQIPQGSNPQIKSIARTDGPFIKTSDVDGSPSCPPPDAVQIEDAMKKQKKCLPNDELCVEESFVNRGVQSSILRRWRREGWERERGKLLRELHGSSVPAAAMRKLVRFI